MTMTMTMTMTKKLALALVTTVLFTAWGPKEMNQQIDQTNFLVDTGCSGTLIDKDAGYILTAHHCIRSQYEDIERETIDDKGRVVKETVRVIKPGVVTQITYQDSFETRRTSYVYQIVSSDQNLDLALLKVKAKLSNSQAARIACKAPERGDAVYVVGNPYAILYSSVTKGIVSSNDRNYPMLGIDTQGENRLMQISAGIVGGNSGGAVYNDQGELVGVPVRGSSVNEIIGLAVPLPDVKSFLSRAKLDNLWAHCLLKPTKQ